MIVSQPVPLQKATQTRVSTVNSNSSSSRGPCAQRQAPTQTDNQRSADETANERDPPHPSAIPYRKVMRAPLVRKQLSGDGGGGDLFLPLLTPLLLQPFFQLDRSTPFANAQAACTHNLWALYPHFCSTRTNHPPCKRTHARKARTHNVWVLYPHSCSTNHPLVNARTQGKHAPTILLFNPDESPITPF